MKLGVASDARDRLIPAWICRPDELGTAALRTFDVEIHDSSPCLDEPQWVRPSVAAKVPLNQHGHSGEGNPCAKKAARAKLNDSGSYSATLGPPIARRRARGVLGRFMTIALDHQCLQLSKELRRGGGLPKKFDQGADHLLLMANCVPQRMKLKLVRRDLLGN